VSTIEATIPPPQASLHALLRQGESRRLEFKRVSGKMVGKALETLCAFANGDGGTLVLGIADLKAFSGELRVWGVEENMEAVDELRRKLLTSFQPPLVAPRFEKLPCTLHNGPGSGSPGHVLLITVGASRHVHSVTEGGTFIRMDAGNRAMSAVEITELSYRRGARSATHDTVPVAMDLLETDVWRMFVEARGLRSGTLEQKLLRLGLAQRVGEQIQPTRAAVLLFADEPGSLLAAQETRADVRVMIYDGKSAKQNATPNLRRSPKTIRGPLLRQIDAAVNTVLDALAEGLTLSGSGFKTQHAYPERVVKEAIVNAVIHRDYRLNRDIMVRIFDDRVEVESPGVFPGTITPATIATHGSLARNPLVATTLREFPVPPNIDAGEGVKTMFAEMAQAQLYPPQFRLNTSAAVESVTVILSNVERPTVWDEVNDWLDRKGTIANADVVRMAQLDTLKASKLLKIWRDQGLLEPLPGLGKRNMAYRKRLGESVEAFDALGLFSEPEENNPHEDD
jgi:ATP-dependent DNA helicase RecG